jgi:hypothetical protein
MDPLPPGLDLPPLLPPKALKKRHGFLFTWLMVMIAADMITICLELVGRSAMGALEAANTTATLPPEPRWFIYGVVSLATFDIFCAICLFFWKKWAFFGSVVASLGIMALNVADGKSPGNASTALFMTAVLYVALQLGDEKSGWHRLK